jgi:hypothetical protein
MARIARSAKDIARDTKYNQYISISGRQALGPAPCEQFERGDGFAGEAGEEAEVETAEKADEAAVREFIAAIILARDAITKLNDVAESVGSKGIGIPFI